MRTYGNQCIQSRELYVIRRIVRILPIPLCLDAENVILHSRNDSYFGNFC